jgi:circadian clock protein KaiB
MKRKVVLRLYVTGSAPNSVAALTNLRAVRAALSDHEVEVVDVLKQPEQAMADSVLVTPTLVKLWPRPRCRIVGNLRDTGHVLNSLGVFEQGAA